MNPCIAGSSPAMTKWARPLGRRTMRAGRWGPAAGGGGMMQTIDSERRRRSGPGLHEAAATTAKLWPAAAILLLLAGCGQGDSAAPPQPPPAVGVRPAEYKGVSWAYEFVGRIKAINIVELRARVEGFLDKVAFIEGQDVKAGDLLYQIEKDQYQAR